MHSATTAYSRLPLDGRKPFALPHGDARQFDTVSVSANFHQRLSILAGTWRRHLLRASSGRSRLRTRAMLKAGAHVMKDRIKVERT